MILKHSALAIFIFLSSCAPKEPEKDILRVAINARPPTLDPRKGTEANGQRILSLIFNGLVRVGEPGKAEPDLAYRWEFKGQEGFFYLKPNLRFSNGRLVSKEDILFSFKEFQKKSSPFHSAFKNIQLVEVKEQDFKNEDNTSSSANIKSQKHFVVKIFLKSFQAPFVSADLPVLKILPKQEILKSPEKFQKTPWGTGDFKAIKNDFREILLERVRPAPPFFPKHISFQIIRDSLTRTQLMLSQAVDIAPSVIPLQKIYKFQRQKELFRVFSKPSFSTTYLLINLKHDLLKNRELREALSLSLNRKEIIKYKLKSYAEPARSLIPPGSYFFNKDMAPLVFDLQKAKAIVSRLFLQEETRLQLSCSNNQETVNQARVLASQLSQTGLKISLLTHEWGAFYKDVGQGAYELALMKWIGVLDPDIYRLSLHSENIPPRGRNRSFYKNPTLDRLLDQGLREPNREKRKLIYDQVQSLVSQDLALIPLWHDMDISIVGKNIEGYKLRTNGDFLSLTKVRKNP